MARIVDDATELVGSTPLVRLNSFGGVLAKLEQYNPYSVKDRIAREMVEAAEAAGELDADATVVEPTSGNTGIGLAFVCAVEGYDLTLTMPESMSEERRKLLASMGADLVLTDADDGMSGAIDAAKERSRGDDAVMLRQFRNEANPRAHRLTTGKEVWEATDGEVGAFVAGVGTGGTVTGVAEYLTEIRDADADIVAVEPERSAVLSGEEPGDHGIQGIGAGFVPEVLREALIDEIETVHREDAVAAARRLAREEGIVAGLSSGAALVAAERVAERDPDGPVVTVLPDSGERYLSTDLYE
ncbi:cysteine synthase A [Halostella sp. JP-L12]|uniref:cysteine synthase A n=1 Tax=Halostella TaxID=1843185 RepID=UPI000EF793C2|nr:MULTISPECIES: cysteine synthase A [Halostella]NHN49850.1 cysteine synthase A [Halostella sp. JP-L12]